MKFHAPLIAWVLLGCSVAGADVQVDKIFARARSVNPGLRDYTTEVTVNLHATIGPVTYQPKGKGTYYYKRDDLHKLDVSEGPRQLKNYPMVFGFNLPQLENFDSSVVEETSYKGGSVYHCRLTPKSPTDSITQIDLLIDKSNFTVPNYVTQYRNQGRLSVDVDFITVDKYIVFDKMRAQADFPSAGTSASGEATYSHYTFNQNLSNKMFSWWSVLVGPARVTG